MLDKIQFLLSLQIIGFCIFGGLTLLLRASDNRAKKILGWGMFLWAFLAAIRLSVNLYLHEPKEAFHPDILIMDEPTRGIDVGAKYEIYQIMIDLVKQGKSIIMISSEMPELIGMSNRIIVMCNGHITGEVEGEEATQERIMSFATQFDLQGKSTTESK